MSHRFLRSHERKRVDLIRENPLAHARGYMVAFTFLGRTDAILHSLMLAATGNPIYIR